MEYISEKLGLGDSSDSDDPCDAECYDRKNAGRFPKLSSDHCELESHYDVIIVGSGYGASIAASRCARAGRKVCILERGKEWLPGSFPENQCDAAKHLQINYQGAPDIVGDATDLYEAVVSKDITVIKGCGLGGTSLINANVALVPNERVFDNSIWPQEIQNDMTNLMTEDLNHVHQMLRPTEYPDDFPKLKKMEAMQKAAKCLKVGDIEDAGNIFKKTPLYVNFDKEKTNETKYRFDQPACNGCGNCVTGCNTGAKNTLNMNYLPDAKVHGAKIFTLISVVSVEKDQHSSCWKVHYKQSINEKDFEVPEQVLTANYVILGAGALGSTKILLKSKERCLKLSEKIGSNFSGNGDVLSFCYHSDHIINACGRATGKYDKIKSDSPGPCITSVIDLRSLPGIPYKDGMVIQDGSPPGATVELLEQFLLIAGKTYGISSFSMCETFEKFAELLKDEEMEKTLSCLVMSHDDSSGIIKVDPSCDGIFIEWEDAGRQKSFEKVDERLLEVTTALGGTYVVNPIWTEFLDKKVVTVHPLGGCPMAEDGKNGAVNHKGQVFAGDGCEVHSGLYVMDGSIIPTSLGVNPTITISMMTERCCRLLAEDAGWKIDYNSFKNFNDLKCA